MRLLDTFNEHINTKSFVVVSQILILKDFIF